MTGAETQSDLAAADLPAAMFADGAGILSAIDTAIWIYDFDRRRIAWANRAALRVCGIASSGEIARRDLLVEVFASVRLRLAQHGEELRNQPDVTIREDWTLGPAHSPFRARAALRRIRLEDGRIGVLIETHPKEYSEPTPIESTDLLGRTGTMIATFNRQGRVCYANPAYRATFGRGEDYFEKAFLSPFDYVEIEDALERYGAHRITAEMRTRAGRRWHLLLVARCRDDRVGEGGFVVSATDVTNERLRLQQAEAARNLAEERVRSESRVLAMIHRKIRTPLNGIIGIGSLLERSGLSEAQRQQVALMTSCGLDILDLADNTRELLDIGKDPSALDRTEFNLNVLVTSVIADVEHRLLAKNLRLIRSLPDTSGLVIRHDADRISQVLRQLLSNAVKFTERGSVHVRAELIEENGLVFEVADSGVGMTEDNTRRIFERFFQIETSDIRAGGGAGIGLSISKELVESWGGELSVRSTPGRGSIFRFTVPDCVSGRTVSGPETSGRKTRHLRVISTDR